MRMFANLMASLALAGAVSTPVAAACWEAEEYEAARMRDLQTVLMVSALKCGRADGSMPGAYNRWVGRAKDKFVAGEQKLLAHFVREGDKARYDKFTTALANRYSEYAEDAKFCERAKALLDADEKHNGVLEQVALLINSKPNGVEEICPVKKPPASQIIVSPFDPIPDPRNTAQAADAVPPAETATATPPPQTAGVEPAPQAAAMSPAADAQPASPAPAPTGTTPAATASEPPQ
jgi:hypothetical protein